MNKNNSVREKLFRSLNKTLLIMRIAIILLLIGFLQTQANDAYSQKATLSVSFSNTELAKVLDKIETQSEFYFLYNEKLIDATRKVSIEAKDKRIEEVLKSLFTGTDVEFSIIDRKIILAPSYLSQSQQPIKKITGKVTDSSGASLPGVSVVVKGTTTGVITNNEGKFMLSLPDGAKTIVFSFVGMKSQEIDFGDKTTINVVLTEETIGLGEVVAVGYATQRKESVSAAIGTVGSKELAKSPSANVANSLLGHISGVLSIQSQGTPGNDNSSIFVRGMGTTGNTSALYVIDGIPRESIDFQRLSTTEIDNISILKDASAAAVFGARGANGVILVTTKRGSAQKTTFDYSFNYGIQQSTRLPEFLDSYGYASLYNIASKNEGKPAPYTDDDIQKFKDGSDPIFHPNTDWLSTFKGSAPMTQHNLSVSGGNEKIKYYSSFNYLDQKNLVNDKYGFKRMNLRMNLDAQVTNTTKFALDISGYLSTRIDPANGYNYGDPTRVAPIFVNKYPNGLWGPGFSTRNPAASLNESGYSTVRNDGLLTRLEIVQDLPFIKGLSVKGVAAYDYKPNKNKTWTLPVKIYNAVKTGSDIRYDQIGGTELPTLSDNWGNSTNFVVEAHVMYKRSFNKHNVDGLLLYSQQAQNSENISGYRKNFLSDQLDILNAGGKTTMENSGSANQYRRQSIVGRLSYNYDVRYLLELSFRYDGSDLFAQGKRFGLFPAVSAGWVISKEKFMKDISFINNLKLRGSYGTLGNDQIGQYQYLQFYGYGTGISMGNGSAYQDQLYMSRLPNTAVTWEKAKKTDIGFEALLLKNFTLEADLFWEKRNDILGLRTATVPDYLGISSGQFPYENFQKVNNKGLELVVGHNKYFANGISIKNQFNFTSIKNTVIDIGEAFDKPARIKQEGRPLGSRFGYIASGLFQSAEEITNAYGTNYPQVKPGDIHYVDINGDKKIDGNDITCIGTSNIPDKIFGLNSNVSYKGIEFSMFWQAGTGSQNYLATYLAQPFEQASNALKAHWDYWSPDNTDAKYPRITTSSTWNNNNTSSFWQYKMNYLRLKNVEIAYSIPVSLISKLHVRSLRVNFNAVNLLTFSPYKEVDPEIGATSSSIYPQQIIYNFGAQITF